MLVYRKTIFCFSWSHLDKTEEQRQFSRWAGAVDVARRDKTEETFERRICLLLSRPLAAGPASSFSWLSKVSVMWCVPGTWYSHLSTLHLFSYFFYFFSASSSESIDYSRKSFLFAAACCCCIFTILFFFAFLSPPKYLHVVILICICIIVIFSSVFELISSYEHF